MINAIRLTKRLFKSNEDFLKWLYSPIIDGISKYEISIIINNYDERKSIHKNIKALKLKSNLKVYEIKKVIIENFPNAQKRGRKKGSGTKITPQIIKLMCADRLAGMELRDISLKYNVCYESACKKTNEVAFVKIRWKQIKNDFLAGVKPKDIAAKYNVRVQNVYIVLKKFGISAKKFQKSTNILEYLKSCQDLTGEIE